MKLLGTMPRLKGFRHPREIIAYAVWAYHRFALSTADVEDLLVERGVIVSRERSVSGSIVSGRILLVASAVTGHGRMTSGTSMRS